jgi:hypothetical protein
MRLLEARTSRRARPWENAPAKKGELLNFVGEICHAGSTRRRSTRMLSFDRSDDRASEILRCVIIKKLYYFHPLWLAAIIHHYGGAVNQGLAGEIDPSAAVAGMDCNV